MAGGKKDEWLAGDSEWSRPAYGAKGLATMRRAVRKGCAPAGKDQRREFALQVTAL